MKINNLLFLIFLIGLTSCEKDLNPITQDVSTKSEVLLTINVDPGSSNSPDWKTNYLITDPDGQILDMHQYVNGEKQIQLSSDVNYEGKLNLYEVVQSPDYLIITVSLDHKKGTVIGETFQDELPKKIINTPFKTVNFTGFNRASYSTSRFVERFESPGDTTRASANFEYQLNDRFYMQLVKGDKGFYNFFEIKPENGTFIADASKCTIPSTRKEIKLAKNDLLRYGYIYGVPNTGTAFPQPLDFFQSQQNENAVLFYPGGVYQSYLTNIGYTKNYYPGDKTYQSFWNTYKGGVPNTDVLLNAAANIIKPEFRNFEASFTGKFKYYVAGFSKTINLSDKSLDVYISVLAPSHIPTFKLPDLSAVVSNISYMDNMKLTQLALVDYNCDEVSWYDFYSGKAHPKKYIAKENTIQYFDNGSITNLNGALPGIKRLVDHQARFMPQKGTNTLKETSLVR